MLDNLIDAWPELQSIRRASERLLLGLKGMRNSLTIRAPGKKRPLIPQLTNYKLYFNPSSF